MGSLHPSALSSVFAWTSARERNCAYQQLPTLCAKSFEKADMVDAHITHVVLRAFRNPSDDPEAGARMERKPPWRSWKLMPAELSASDTATPTQLALNHGWTRSGIRSRCKSI